MSDKISARSVVKESVALCLFKKWQFLGLAAIGLVAGAMTLVPTIAPASMQGPASFVGLVVNVLISIFIVTTISHLAISTMRGDGRAMPDKLPGTMWRVFLRMLLLWLTLMGACIVLFVPLGMIAYAFMTPSGQVPFAALSLLGPAMIIGGIFIYVLLLRLSLMIPGAAVGHVMSLPETWLLTRGHTWKIFGSFLLLALPFVLASMLLGAMLVWGGASSALGFSVSMGLLVVSNTVFFLLMQICFSVWYVHLRERSAGGEAGADAVSQPDSAGLVDTKNDDEDAT